MSRPLMDRHAEDRIVVAESCADWVILNYPDEHERSRVQVKTPVTIYVVHHPDCKEAKELASGLFHWFRLSYLFGDSSSSAAGLPVYFRRQIDGQQLVPSIALGGASLNVVILLVTTRWSDRGTG